MTLPKVFSIVLFSFLIYGLLAFPAEANNVSVSNVSIGSRDRQNGLVRIEFDLSWNNSWRTTTNRDAVWIFAKWTQSSSNPYTWNHCTLKVRSPFTSSFCTNPTGYDRGTVTAGDTPNIIVPSDKMGCFVERSSSGQGDMSITDMQIEWDYSADGLTSTSTVQQIKVFAIEMVYVPQGSFYAGDGATSSLTGHFESSTTSASLQITSEGSLYVGGGTAGSLGNNNASGMTTADDFNDSTSKSLGASFPKGYNAFYLMKYEISEGQYVDFLNTLNRRQQEKRVASGVTGTSPTGGTTYVMSSTVAVSVRNTVQCPGSFSAREAQIAFTCTRADRACNYLSWPDVVAFADWAGLRPFTELEYEKAARGTSAAVIGEYVWATTAITGAAAISGTESGTEYITTSGANACYNNATFTGGDTGQGALRCGIFATSTSSSRAKSGAGFYGNMELAGNVIERTVTVGTASGRAFTGTHGNGVLTTTSGYEGNATNTDWPGIDATTANGVTGGTGAGSRGGSWASTNTYLRTSDRTQAAVIAAGRASGLGGRLARTGPNS